MSCCRLLIGLLAPAFLASCAAGYTAPESALSAESPPAFREDRLLVAEYTAQIDDLEKQLAEGCPSLQAERFAQPPPSMEPQPESRPGEVPTATGEPSPAPVSPEPGVSATSQVEPSPTRRESRARAVPEQPGAQPLEEAESVPTGGPSAMEPTSTPETPEPVTCSADVCDLRDRICDLSLRICVISGRYPGDEELELQCEDAWGRCERADRQVVESCQCPGWEPVYPG